MEPFEVEFYRKADGSCPVNEFLALLDDKMRTKVMLGIDLLRLNGPAVREPYSKPLGDGIFELRTKQGNGITRILYFFFVGRKIVLTNGFVKKTEKTPPAQIATAKKYRDEYLKQRGKV